MPVSPPPRPAQQVQPVPSKPDDALLKSVRSLRAALKTTGILSIIAGCLGVLTVVGLPVAWIPIVIGVMALGASGRARDYLEFKEPATLASLARKLKGISVTANVVLTISLVVTLAAAAAAVAAVALGHLPETLETLAGTFKYWARLVSP